LLKEGGKTYFPPCYEAQTGKVHILIGYCDDKPRIEDIDITDITMP